MIHIRQAHLITQKKHMICRLLWSASLSVCEFFLPEVIEKDTLVEGHRKVGATSRQSAAQTFRLVRKAGYMTFFFKRDSFAAVLL
jgi:hypothetical protein